MFTTEERLKLYQQALKDWKESGAIYDGLCCYLILHMDTEKIHFKQELPELYLTKPKESSYGSFWFKPWIKAPRIRCLQQAIKLTKAKL